MLHRSELRAVQRPQLRRSAAVVAVVLCFGCPSNKPQAQRSSSLPSVAERVGTVCNWSLCPSTPLDAAFHLLPTEEGMVVHAIVKVRPDEVHRWAEGCDDFNVEVRPAWVSEVLPSGWKLLSNPDTWRCGGEKRVIHVKEGIVIRALRTPWD